MKYLTLILGLISVFCIAKSSSYNTYLQKLHEKGKFNGTALIIKNDSVLLKKAYGVIDKGSSALLQTNTLFRIASLSKAFTAVAIMQQK